MDNELTKLEKNVDKAKTLGKVVMLLGLVIGVIGIIGQIDGLVVFAIIVIVAGLVSPSGTVRALTAKRAQLNREANARKRIRDIFTQAGNLPAEVEDKTKLAETLLRQGKGDDWPEFGPTKISEIVQGVEALKGKRPPLI